MSIFLHDVDLAALVPHGQINASMRDGELCVAVAGTPSFSHCKPGIPNRHYVELPVRCTVPFRLDITAKTDALGLYVEIGNGHASFGVHKQDNRRLDDICEPKRKPKLFDSRIIINAYNKISLIYGYKEMQVLVNGDERYFSKTEPYIKSRLFAKMNSDGFAIKISGGKNTNVAIRSIQVTEYVGVAKVTRPLPTSAPLPEPQAEPDSAVATKPTFESLISGLPQSLITEIVSLDAWLKKLRPLKFTRTIDKNGDKITYLASAHGFSYAIYPDGDLLYHQLQWYIITNRKPELWGRKDDRMEDVIAGVAQADAQAARRMFGNLHDCVGGRGAGCLAKTRYSYEGTNKITCHGSMRFKMSVSDFDDVRTFITTFNDLLSQDIEKNTEYALSGETKTTN